MSEEKEKNWHDVAYKKLLLIPILLLILSLVYLVFFTIQNKDIIYKDISLTGGTSITVFSQANIDDLKSNLGNKLDDLVVREISDIRTGKQEAFIIETTTETEKAKQAVQDFLNFNLTTENSSIEFTGSTLGENFYKQLILAILFAFGFMGAVVFFIFGKKLKIKTIIILLALLVPFLFSIKAASIEALIIFQVAILLLSSFFYLKYSIPSFAVILSAFADITLTLAVVDFLGIKVSTAGIVAFLMLIGYSVDTDILLTTRLLRTHDDTINKRIFKAFKTGITMTLTSITAVTAALLLTYSFSQTLQQIFFVLLLGLSFDIMNTWILNTGILKIYLEKKK